MESLKSGRRLAGRVLVFFLAWGAGFQPAIGSAQALRREGQFQSVSGPVTAQSAGEAKPRTVAPGDVVSAQDRVVTGPAGKAQLQLEDGSLITLQPSSRIQILDSRANARHSSSVLLVMGWLQAMVAPEAGSNLEVQTATAVAGVRGTEFTVAAAADGASRVGVAQGQVELSGQDQAVTLAPNQQASLELGNKAFAPEPYNPQTTDWSGFLSQRARRLAKKADQMASEMDRELARRQERALQSRQGVTGQLQRAETMSGMVDEVKDQPDQYAGKREGMKQVLEQNYSQARSLQREDAFLVANNELLTQLIQDVKDHPENYSAAARKKVLALEKPVRDRNVDGIHQENQATLDSYTGKLDALVAKYELGRELQQREYFEKRQQQEDEWLRKRQEFQEQHRPK